MNRCRLMLALCATLLLTPVTRAQTLTALADSHITDNVGDAIPNHYNFGAMNYVLVQNDPARVYKTYLRFDLAPIAAAGNLGVRAATLALTFSRFREQPLAQVKEAATITVYGITDNVDEWSEGTATGKDSATDLTFNNAPHNNKLSNRELMDAGARAGAAVREVATFIVPRNTPPGTEFRIDAAPFVNWALRGGAYGLAPGGDADKKVTFVLVHTGGNLGVANNGVQFYSRENKAGPGNVNLPSAAPRLIYVVETTPSFTEGVVATVVDAETLLVRGVGNVRLAGITTLRDPKRKPLADDDVFGEESDRAARRLAAGRKVRLEFEGGGRDARGAALAWVFLDDGSLLNEQMVRRGYAKVGPLAADNRYHARLRAAETDARSARRGLWPKQTPPTRPARG